MFSANFPYAALIQLITINKLGLYLLSLPGTDMFRQFIGQVNGAEEKALQILKFVEADTDSKNKGSNADFDFDKFIRV